VVLKSIFWNCSEPVRKPHPIEHEVVFDIVPDLVNLRSNSLGEMNTNTNGNEIEKNKSIVRKLWYAYVWVEYDDPKIEEIKNDINKLENEILAIDQENNQMTQEFDDNSEGYYSKVDDYKKQIGILEKNEFTFAETESILEMLHKMNEIG